ncbi:putative fungal specific transcription factor [Metarhizium anisopliae]
MVVEDTGELRYFGPSASLAILSPGGLEWLELHTNDSTLRQRLLSPLTARGNSWAKWAHPHSSTQSPASLNCSSCSTAASATQSLPWEEASSLVNEFLENFNIALPIFHPPTLTSLLEKHYATNLHTDRASTEPAWPVALFSVLAMAQRKRAEESSNPQEALEKAWNFADRAVEGATSVLMSSVSMLSVQGILTLAWFFYGTPNPQPFFSFSAAAVRLVHAAGMHRTTGHSLLSPTDKVQRNRLFWIALIFDSTAAARTGRPCTQDINDIGVPLPALSPRDNLGILLGLSGDRALNILVAKSRLAMIQCKAYTRLFTTSASAKSIGDIEIGIGELGTELDELSLVIPSSRPGRDAPSHTLDWHPGHYSHIIGLVMALHGCIITVHSATWYRDSKSSPNRDARRAESKMKFRHLERCLHSSVEIERLACLIPRHRNNLMWEAVSHAHKALMPLVIAVLSDPSSEDAEGQLRCMERLVLFTSELMASQQDTYLKPLVQVSQELARAAREARCKAGRVAEGDSGGANSGASSENSVFVQPSFTAYLRATHTGSAHADGSVLETAQAETNNDPGVGACQTDDLISSLLWDWQGPSGYFLGGLDTDGG